MKVVLGESGFGMKLVLDENGIGMKVVLDELVFYPSTAGRLTPVRVLVLSDFASPGTQTPHPRTTLSPTEFHEF